MGFPLGNASEHHILQNFLSMQENASESYYRGFIDEDLEFHILDIMDNFLDNEDNFDTLDMDNIEKMEYKYNPIQLCVDLYETHDFWQIILMINDMDSEGEFDLKSPIKVPKKEEFLSFTTQMYDLVRHEFNDNNRYEKINTAV